MASEGKSQGDAAAATGQRQAVTLHPMALLGMADHHTRIEAGQSPGHTRAVGLLFGSQTEEAVDIIMTADSLETLVEGKTGLDMTITNMHAKIVSEVYPTYEILGWYAVCPNGVPSASDFAFHSQVKGMCDAPMFIGLDTAPRTLETTKDLPIAVFASEFVGGVEAWVPVPFKVDAMEAESLTIEAVAGAGQGGEDESDLNPHLEGTVKAIRIARERMAIVRAYVEAVAHGRVEADRELLRLCRAVGNALPAADSAAFQSAFSAELVDSQVIAMLSALTRAADTANGALDKLGLATAGRQHARALMGAGGLGGGYEGF